MRSIIWLVLIGLIGLGMMVAIKIGTAAPEGADVDQAKVGTAVEPARRPTQGFTLDELRMILSTRAKDSA